MTKDFLCDLQYFLCVFALRFFSVGANCIKLMLTSKVNGLTKLPGCVFLLCGSYT